MVLLAVAFLAYILYLSIGHSKYRVEVCMAFNGQSSCKTAGAGTESGALRTATEGACADVSSGVTDTVKCQNTPPQRTRWISRP